ncbi:MAG TPA: cellulose binding domain-containing protein [Ktedonobacteraceae bacterium]|nr:cellulose binding domain-containing protein [Ktedonobacteraceae bacterium]
MSTITARFTTLIRILLVGVFMTTSVFLLYHQTAKAAQVCNNGSTITMGKYWLNSNLWGANTGSGSQCIWDTSISGSNIAWGTSWNWTGQANSVKSYDSSVLGWHWGWMNSNTGLPIQLSSNQSVQTSWSYNLTQTTPGGIDVSYDTWLSPNPNLGNANPSDEVMVWLYHGGGVQPVGSRQTTVTIDGTSWDLWQGSTSWQVYSFVRTSNTSSQSLNLMDFYQYLISRGLSSSKYLLSVESGTEIFTGAGQLNTTSYSTNVGTGSGGPTPTPNPTHTPTPTPTSTPTGNSVHVGYQVTSQWSNGFSANIAITNNSATTINGWKLQFAFPGNQQITQLWNGSESQIGNQVTVTNASYNATIAPGQSVSVGFNGTLSGSNPNPTSFTLNGSPTS